jgi:hypothetical protein
MVGESTRRLCLRAAIVALCITDGVLGFLPYAVGRSAFELPFFMVVSASTIMLVMLFRATQPTVSGIGQVFMALGAALACTFIGLTVAFNLYGT